MKSSGPGRAGRRRRAAFVLHFATASASARASVVVASGARYRRLAVDNLDEFEMSSVHYWASPLEAKLCANQEIALVGAGNSAGQAAVYLASQGAKVWMLVRRPSLSETMSRYLVDRIEGLPNVEVVTGAQVSGLEGSNGILEAVRWRHRRDRRRGAAADPPLVPVHRRRAEYRLACRLRRYAGRQGLRADRRGCRPAPRHPLETSRRGVFAIGDVRATSIKRVAAAVGEGAQVVAALHAYLAGDRAGDPVTAPNPLAPAQRLELKARRDGAAAQRPSPRVCAACQA